MSNYVEKKTAYPYSDRYAAFSEAGMKEWCWVECSKTEKERVDLDCLERRVKVQYANVANACDLETTSIQTITRQTKSGKTVDIVDNKRAWMWIWMIGLNGVVIYGRTWDEFLNVLNELKEMLGLSFYKRIIIYVHNLGFDWQFFRKFFHWREVFALRERQVLYAVTDDGFEFRCSYKLTNKSLEAVGKDLLKYKVEKMVGDLDYSLVRTSSTPVDEKELGYCINDVRVIMAHIQEQIEVEGSILSIPLTSTGYVRRDVRSRTVLATKDISIPYKKLMQKLELTPEQYEMARKCFSGGFAKGNLYRVGKIVHNVQSLDITSDYPTCMIAQKYPMSKFEKVECKNINDIKRLSINHCLMLHLRFKNLRSKTIVEHPLMSSKCYGPRANCNADNTLDLLENDVEAGNWKLDNGKIISAEVLGTYCTEQDFMTICDFYEWDAMKVVECQAAIKDYLPREIIEACLDYYAAKTTLKGVDGQEAAYARGKALLNSIYGLIVQRLVRDVPVYEGDEWIEPDEPDIERIIYKENKSRIRCTYYPFGVWVTAYARRRLFNAIKEAGTDHVYCDTDSEKMLNYDKHRAYFEADSQKWVDMIKETLSYYNIPLERATPKNKKGVEKPLGVWDDEGAYDDFVTLGSKRYATRKDGETHTTVAGCGKSLAKYLDKLSEENGGSPLDYFRPDLKVPAEYTDKMTHTFIDNSYEFDVEDYLGIVGHVVSPSSVHLMGCEYDMDSARHLIDLSENSLKSTEYDGY